MLQRVDHLLKQKETATGSKPVATPARAATSAPAITDASQVTKPKPKAKVQQFGTVPTPKPAASVPMIRLPEPNAAPAASAELVINTTTHKKQYMKMATCLSTLTPYPRLHIVPGKSMKPKPRP